MLNEGGSNNVCKKVRKVVLVLGGVEQMCLPMLER